MKPQFKFLSLLAFFLLSTNGNLYAQDVIDTLSKEICECVEKEKIKSPNEMNGCFEDAIIINLKKIKESYNAKTIDEINMDEIGTKIGVKLINECQYILDNFPSGASDSDKKVEKQANLNCDDLKNGDFYYIKNYPDLPKDTIYVTIRDKMYLERMEKGKTFSLLDVNWTSNCEFVLTFNQSNNRFNNEMSKKGDTFKYEVMQNDSKSVFLQLNWKGKDYQFELFKMK